jgi:hypothetical protein
MRRVVLSFAASVAVLVVGAMPGYADAPPLEPMYANDTTVFMLAPAPANAVDPASVTQDFYLIAYPTLPTNGNHPLCNFSCPGPSFIPQVRDVVLEGAPGFGASGTAMTFNPNWHVLALVYSPHWVTSADFAPARSAAEVDAGEAAGHFLALFGGGNPFEGDTGHVFVCVLASSNA